MQCEFLNTMYLLSCEQQVRQIINTYLNKSQKWVSAVQVEVRT